MDKYGRLEPITDKHEETASKLKLFTVTALSTLSPIEVYMYFAQIRDLAGAKQAQYQKHYGNAEIFMRSTNYRFRSDYSVGVLTRMMTNARAARKSKKPDAMGVRIIATNDWKESKLMQVCNNQSLNLKYLFCYTKWISLQGRGGCCYTCCAAPMRPA